MNICQLWSISPGWWPMLRGWGHSELPELAGWWLTFRDRCVGEPRRRRGEMGKRGEARSVWAATSG